MANPEKTIGIDLGTTYCCVAVWQHGRPEVIANDQGNRTTPSMVAFTPNERLLGEGAKHQIATNPKNTVFDVKRLIGRRFEDETVKRDVQLWPFTVASDDVGLPVIEVAFKGQTKRFAPQEISAMVLVKMKKIAEDFLNTEVHNAVITVPAYFSDSQRKATKDSATLAGLNVSRVINEPSAAAIAYGFRPEVHSSNVFKTILVFDLGGGTFDVSIVTLQSGKFEVKGVAGDMHLGGEDFDNSLVDYCVKQFMRKNRAASDITQNARALRRLRTECERAKRTLSAAVETVVDIDTLHEGYDFNQRITKAKFEELNEDLFTKCIEIVDKCIEDAGLTKDNINEIVLVGGSSRIPKVQELVEAQFSGKQLCKTLNFDEAVAIGAALQGANLNNEGVELVLTDVVPLSLGISINGGVMNFVVPRNTPIPTEKERKYTTRFDNQTEVMFPLYEGERPFVSENNLLGEFSLTGIPRGPAGLPDIKVVFRVDADGILTVTAKDERSGVTSQIVIAKDSGRLTAPQIERMLKEADMFKKEDMEAIRRLTAKNSLETLINGMRTKMRGNSVKKRAAPSDLAKIREELDNAEMWIEENESLQVAEIEQMVKALQEICSPISF